MLKHVPEINSRLAGAIYGAHIADALAMPVHWYYDTFALTKDYGLVQGYQQPRNPHPDSLLWRSRYRPPSPDTDILHNQAMFWGERGVHYHQFLQAGENTLNMKLGRILMDCLLEDEDDLRARYLARYVSFMTKPGNHRDTYVEECHREFFKAWATRNKEDKVIAPDEKHMGGLCMPIPILLYFHDQPQKAFTLGLQHMELTHPGQLMKDAFTSFSQVLQSILQGMDIRQALEQEWPENLMQFAGHPFEELAQQPDAEVALNVFNTACYVQQALPLTYYLAWKYQDDPEMALIVNTNLGGDNCHRGAVLGTLMGAMHGDRAWPEKWLSGLYEPPSEFARHLAAFDVVYA
ncbi:ADP-ribosylglycohydrolase [Desulfonatronum thiosulfatophilum]|uniref:ADP-ribosylglycohydrolase n=1 Tax=Desulfonatronum thiosulfatophilum TaxID=617002 RepID=A0A1G6E8W5_9BACT|nr:ADP-ribosylglycohydrolase family protein [Desulfonatronum thiosulfatophilum]SDB53904.1 ADP-ribosylglycohydrolase [Desulfonatronum thiosulfatophilum]